MNDIAILDPEETKNVLANRASQTGTLLGRIAEHLMEVVDTPGSVFAVGLTEQSINSLRTKMHRRGIAISVNKAERGADHGHLIRAERYTR